MIRDAWERRSSRERRVLSVAAVLVAWFVVSTPVTWVTGRLAEMDRKVEKRREDLIEAKRLAAEYTRLTGRLSRLEARSEGSAGETSLLSFLEGVSTRMGTRDRIVSMKPQVQATPEGISESTVDVRIENVDLPELVGMLALVEDSPDMLQVKRLRMKTRYNDPGRLDASFTVSALQRQTSPRGQDTRR